MRLARSPRFNALPQTKVITSESWRYARVRRQEGLARDRDFTMRRYDDFAQTEIPASHVGRGAHWRRQPPKANKCMTSTRDVANAVLPPE